LLSNHARKYICANLVLLEQLVRIGSRKPLGETRSGKDRELMV